MAYASTIDGKTVDRNYSAVANLLDKVPFVRSFKIHRAADQHALTINQNRFIGKYPTQDAALGSLMGCVKAGGGGEDFAIASIENMIANGQGLFTSAGAVQSFTMSILNGGITGPFTNVSGDAIISTTSHNLDWKYSGNLDKLRLWFGPYSGQPLGTGGVRSGDTRYPFANTTDAYDYFQRFTFKVSINGGSEITLAASSAQTPYVNTTTALGSNIWGALGNYTINFNITEN